MQPTAPDDSGDRVRYVDCDTWIGRGVGNRNVGGVALSAADLLSELDRLGVAGALTYHVLAKEYAPAVGNAAVLDEVSGQPRLSAIWAVMPDHTEEVPPSDRLPELMLSAGVRMARMFPAWSPQAHRFSLEEWCVGDLLRALEAARMPLECDFTLFRRGEPPWPDIYRICHLHPKLPVILMDIQGRNNRTLYALLKQCPNAHVQTSGLNVHHGLADFRRHFGPERLIFGSGYPIKTLGGAVLQVERSGLSDDDRRLVAAGNLERLVGQAALR